MSLSVMKKIHSDKMYSKIACSLLKLLGILCTVQSRPTIVPKHISLCSPFEKKKRTSLFDGVLLCREYKMFTGLSLCPRKGNGSGRSSLIAQESDV